MTLPNRRIRSKSIMYKVIILTIILTVTSINIREILAEIRKWLHLPYFQPAMDLNLTNFLLLI